MDLTTSIRIERPVAQVAACASDPVFAPEWYGHISSVEWETPPPVAVGSRVQFVASFLGRTLRCTYQIREVVPHEWLVMSTAQGPFAMETTYAWSPAGPEATTRTLRNRGEPAGFSRLMTPVMSSAMRRANSKDLRRLKQILESR